MRTRRSKEDDWTEVTRKNRGYRTKEDDLVKVHSNADLTRTISKSIFVTNFPDNTTSADLWHFPSFKFLSPSQIVDNQGCVKDIDNSPGNGNGNALSEPPRSLKRKFEDIPKILDDDVVIVARYLKKVTLFLLPSTSTFAYAKDNISKDFHLDSLHFTLEDECDDGTCFRIDDKESLESCIAWGRTNRSHIKLRVHPRH
ncbi:hypothetical protein Tco_1148445 [Tanacetum coccineum]